MVLVLLRFQFFLQVMVTVFKVGIVLQLVMVDHRLRFEDHLLYQNRLLHLQQRLLLLGWRLLLNYDSVSDLHLQHHHHHYQHQHQHPHSLFLLHPRSTLSLLLLPIDPATWHLLQNRHYLRHLHLFPITGFLKHPWVLLDPRLCHNIDLSIVIKDYFDYIMRIVISTNHR